MLGYPPAEVTGRHLTAFLPQGVIDASIYRNGPFLGTLGTIRDISERISMEQALRESEERFRVITEQTSDVVFITDTRGVITYLSPAAVKVFGFKMD